ncbi:MAG TPA: hypothetical protein VGD66_15150 [Allosphingosinicella sp.]|jgi:hypothetical protein
MAATWSTHKDEQVQRHELVKDRFWGRLVTETARAAAAASADEHEREDNIRCGLDVVEAAARAVNPNWWGCDEEHPALGWRHRSSPMLAGKKYGEPYIIRLDVEEAASCYLALPFRVDGLDRLLADMLMAAELFAFADEVQQQLKQKLPTVLAWLWGNLMSLVIGLSIAGVLLWLSPDATVMQWIAGIVAGLTLLGAAFSLVVFPFLYPGVRAQRQKFNATVMGMTAAYTTLGGSPASVPHIRKLVDRAMDAGVVWPAPLMALLDDIADRRKSI